MSHLPTITGSPLERRAMAALTATGHYEETPDSFEWLLLEAADIARIIEGGGRVADLYALLADTAFHDITVPAEAACLRRDAEAIVAALEES